MIKVDNHGCVAIFKLCIPFILLLHHPVSQTISDIKEGLKLFFIHTAWILAGAVDTVFHTVDSETGVIIQLIKQWL